MRDVSGCNQHVPALQSAKCESKNVASILSASQPIENDGKLYVASSL